MTNAIWGTEDAARFPGTNVERNDITMLPNGGYVVTWREALTKVGFQLYNGLGEKVGEAQFVVGSSDQRFADVHAVGPDGDFVVTWSENSGSLYTQKFNVLGTAIGGQTELPTAGGTEDEFALASNSQGGWATAFIEGSPAKVKLVEYDSSGVPGASVEIAGGSGLGEPDVAYLGGSKYLVSYRSDGGVTSKIVDNSVVGNPIFIAAPGGAVVPHVAALKDANGAPTGEFVVVTDLVTSVSAQKYSATGEPIGASVTIVAAGGKDGVDHDMNVTALKDGGYAVVYGAHSMNPDGSGDLADIFVKAIHGDGSEGQPIRVNARAPIDGGGANQDTVVISEMADGRLSVAWHDRTLGNGLISSVIVDTRTAAVTVHGTSHDDIYVGSDFGGDVLDGAGGNDLLIGGLGGDALKGGAGIDTASFQYATAGVVAGLIGGGSGGEAAGDTYEDIENLRGSNHNDYLAGNAGANLIDGGAGSDTVSYAGQAANITVNLTTGAASDGDVLVSIENAVGTSGNDTLIGNAGINVLDGGAGDDTCIVQDAGDVVLEAAGGGVDTVTTSVSFALSAFVEKLIATGTGALSLTGNDLANTITGNDADNVINGGAGADTMIGGAGNDIYYVDNIGDVIVDTAGNDTVVVSGSVSVKNFTGIENVVLSATGGVSIDGSDFGNTLSGNDAANVLNGFGGNDVLMGLGGNDQINGGDGNDLLKGGDGIDILRGEGGNDTIYGGAGKDTLYGGTGRDVFAFDTKSNKKTNLDKIADYSVKDDTIWLDNAVFTNKIGKGTPEAPRKLSAAFFKVGTKAADKNDYIVYNKAKGVLYYDSDGSGSKAMVEIATLTKNLKMTAADFFVI